MIEHADALLEEYCKTRSVELRNELVERHLNTAHMVARRFSGRGVDYDDLYQVAALALMKALERYDSSKGVKFISFAIPSMVGEVKNFFRDRSRLIRMPRRNGELVYSIDRARGELTQKLQRSPTAEELAREIGVPLEDVLETLEMQNAILSPVSLDNSAVDEDDDFNLHGMLGFEEEGYDQIEKRDLVQKAVGQLPELFRQVLHERYFHERSQRDVAKMLDISQMTVSRVERKAIMQLQKLLKAE